jgi:hypothetical protein
VSYSIIERTPQRSTFSLRRSIAFHSSFIRTRLRDSLILGTDFRLYLIEICVVIISPFSPGKKEGKGLINSPHFFCSA